MVPFYNVEQWITYCVRSVKAQKYDNYKCYLIDDISTDKTPEIIKKEIEEKTQKQKDNPFKLKIFRE